MLGLRTSYIRVLFVAALLSLRLTLPQADAGGPPPSEFLKLFESAAGRIIAEEMGLSFATRSKSVSSQVDFSETQAQVLTRSLARIRARYLEARPQDEAVFERPTESAESIRLKSGQIELLRESVFVETELNPEFIRAGKALSRSFRSEAEAFLGHPLPEQVHLSIDQSRALELFNKARSNFISNFDPKRLRELLKQLESSDSPDAAIRLELKSRRKEVAILRGSYSILSQAHEAPWALHAYARDFGRLNDALESGISEQIHAAAKALDRSLTPKKILKTLDHFEPASNKSLQRYVKQLTGRIRISGAREILPIEEFHDLRKELKEILNVLYLSEQLRSVAEIKAGYDFLYQLNEDLGLMHDEIVARSLRGEIQYDGQEIVMPEHFRTAIQNFLKRLEISVN